MPGLFSQLKALNDNLNVNQKLSIVALGLLTAFGILAFVYLVNQQSYQLLISDLDADSARQVTEGLERQDIPFKLSNGGRDISVPPEDLNEAMLEIAGEGLVHKGRVGFEIFDENSWSMTDFGEKVKFQRALEGTLERTILELDAISKARVHIAFEKESIFAEQEKPAKASVVVGLKGGGLSRKNVGAIENLVASAVQGLSPDNVTVVSADGALLSRAEPDTDMLDEQQVLFRRNMEREMSEKVRRMLERTVGESKVEVQTSLALDFSEVQQKELIRDPVLASEQEVRRLGPGGQGVGGVPGTVSNEGEDPQADEALDGARVTQNIKNYDHSLLERMRRAPGGEIQRISMAVVIDHKTVAEENGRGETVERSVPWPPEEIERLRSLVASTIGLDEQRGDRLTLENIPLIERSAPPKAAEPGFWENYRHLVYPALRWTGILALFLLFYLMIFRPVKRRVFSYVEGGGAHYANRVANDPERPGQLPPGGRAALPEGESAKREDELSPEERRQAEVMEVARRKPEAVTGLLREWLSEGQGV